MIPAVEDIARLSREFALLCDAEGVVVWADDRAAATLDATPGRSLADLCVPGTAGKATELLGRAIQEPIEGWELSLADSSSTLTVTFNGTPTGGFALLVGHVAPRVYQTAIEGMQQAVEDIVHLSRETARQKHQIARYAAELEGKNQELQDSNRGILSLHRELEDRAATLTQHAEVKARVVSSVSHEFRTPLTSILGLTQLLAEGSDGALDTEQEKQVRFIRSSAEELMAMVNDILDLSKIESGTGSLRITSFPASEFVADLRGALKPLVAAESPVALEFECECEGDDFPFETDRAKLSQVMRNLISNAIKFTDKGHVRVSVRAEDDGRAVLSVADSGVGIAAGDVERVFEEFAQLDNPMQGRVRGTGLGLPIARRLTDILGGDIAVESIVGEGSTFTVTLPMVHHDAQEMQQVEDRSRHRDPLRAPVLVVEDDRRTLFVYERYLAMAGFQVIPARTIEAARQALARELPVAIVLDVVLEEENTWSFLSDVKRDPRTQHVPCLVVTVSNKGETARALGADEFWLKPVDQTRLLKKLQSITQPAGPVKVLVVDDDERARYLVRKHLTGRPFELLEASTGEDGVALAQRERPHVILLDFLLESMTAFDVLDELKSDPATRAIPVIIVTAQILDAGAREKLSRTTEAIIAKQNLSRELAINRIRDALRRSGAETQL